MRVTVLQGWTVCEQPGGRACLISLTSASASSGTSVVRKANRPGWRAARAKTASRRALAAAGATDWPVTNPYLANGALTSTAKWASGWRLRTSASTSGRMPLESIRTRGPKAASSAAKSASPATRVGSPPLMTMPSSHLAWEAANRRTDAAESGGRLSGRQARAALWQWGQRKSQPPKKSTAHRRPGQSQRDTGSMPRTRSQAGETFIFSSDTEVLKIVLGPSPPRRNRREAPWKSRNQEQSYPCPARLQGAGSAGRRGKSGKAAPGRVIFFQAAYAASAASSGRGSSRSTGMITKGRPMR